MRVTALMTQAYSSIFYPVQITRLYQQLPFLQLVVPMMVQQQRM